MTERTVYDEIDSTDIEELSEQTGIETDLIESAVQRNASAKRFERYKQTHLDTDTNSRSVSDAIKNFLCFIPKLFIHTRHAPLKGTISDITIPPDNDEMIVEVTAVHTAVPTPTDGSTEYKPTKVVCEEVYDLVDDKQQIQYLLDKTNSNSQADLIGKQVPIHNTVTDRTPNHSIFTKPKTVSETIFNYISFYGNLVTIRDSPFSRASQKYARADYHTYGINPTLFLVLSAVSISLNTVISEYLNLSLSRPDPTDLLFIVLSIISAASLAVVLLYVYMCSIVALKCISEVLTEQPSDRIVIRSVLNS